MPKEPWPYAIAVFIAVFVAFVTWWTLAAASIAAVSGSANAWWGNDNGYGPYGAYPAPQAPVAPAAPQAPAAR